MSGLDDLSADLGRAADAMQDQAEKITKKAGVNINHAWMKQWRGHKMAPRLFMTLGFDQTSGDGWTRIDDGPDIDKVLYGPSRPGPLGGIYEYGTVNNAPVDPAGARALADETPKFEDYLGRAAQKLLEGESGD